jgi:hypothetical protein
MSDKVSLQHDFQFIEGQIACLKNSIWNQKEALAKLPAAHPEAYKGKAKLANAQQQLMFLYAKRQHLQAKLQR